MTKIPFILRPVAILLFTVAVFAGCDDSDNSKSDCAEGSDLVCGVCNPVENLDWLQDKIAEAKNAGLGNYAAFYTATNENQTVFIQTNCCPHCDWAPLVVWTCDGQALDVTTLQGITNQKMIWHGGDCQPHD